MALKVENFRKMMVELEYFHFVPKYAFPKKIKTNPSYSVRTKSMESKKQRKADSSCEPFNTVYGLKQADRWNTLLLNESKLFSPSRFVCHFHPSEK